jgi:hypothetical protein
MAEIQSSVLGSQFSVKVMSRLKLGGLVIACLLVASAPALTFQAAADSQSSSAKSTTAKSQSSPPSAADIAAAKASGKVWVNLESGIYHKSGRWYGKTKNGKFMTADEARKAGFKAAKRE